MLYFFSWGTVIIWCIWTSERRYRFMWLGCKLHWRKGFKKFSFRFCGPHSFGVWGHLRLFFLIYILWFIFFITLQKVLEGLLMILIEWRGFRYLNYDEIIKYLELFLLNHFNSKKFTHNLDRFRVLVDYLQVTQ